MTYTIIRSGERFMVPLILVMSVALLGKGHSLPGGGFAGGLLAACAFSLRAFARDPSPEGFPRSRVERLLLGCGTLLVALVALLPVVLGEPILKVQKFGITLPAEIHVDSSFLFEIGVYLVSCGASLMMVKSLMQKS